MKVIDLLNKIAKGEIPKRIKYNEIIYKYEESQSGTGYVHTYDNGCKWWFSEMIDDSKKALNEEVELLEDEEIGIGELDKRRLNGLDGFVLTAVEEAYVDKINEIIRTVNKMQQDNKIK